MRVVVAPPADPLASRSLAMLAHATRSDGLVPAPDSNAARAPALDGEHAGADPDSAKLALAFLRYLDVVLVLASTPFALLAGVPAAGFAIGAGTWIVTRVGVGFVERSAWSASDMRVRTALHLGAILGRVWLVALAVLIARFALGTPDGITAAVLVLAAYTVELVTKVMLRGSITAGLRRPA